MDDIRFVEAYCIYPQTTDVGSAAVGVASLWNGSPDSYHSADRGGGAIDSGANFVPPAIAVKNIRGRNLFRTKPVCD
ncbi:MAG: hypothetical protein ACREP7_10875 [Lysobacter sp.]